jgi:hypothetical protein
MYLLKPIGEILMLRSLIAIAFTAFFSVACASVPGVPLERVGEVNAALGAIPNPPPGHEFANYSIDGNGVKAQIVPRGVTSEAVNAYSYGSSGYYGGYAGYDSYGYRGGYQGGYGGFGGYSPPPRPPSKTLLGVEGGIATYQACQYSSTWGPICNTVNERQ